MRVGSPTGQKYPQSEYNRNIHLFKFLKNQGAFFQPIEIRFGR